MKTEKKYKLPKVLVLDYEVWRCGQLTGETPTSHGLGPTSLLNSRGYMCCLGQFCLQAGVPKETLLSKGEPSSCGVVVSCLSFDRSNEYPEDVSSNILNSDLSSSAMNINDDSRTSIVEKVCKLLNLFERRKRTIKLKNFPEAILIQIKSERNSHGKEVLIAEDSSS